MSQNISEDDQGLPSPYSPSPESAYDVPEEDFVASNGQSFRIKDSGIMHTVSHKNCASLSSGGFQPLVATIFYNAKNSSVDSNSSYGIHREDLNYGPHVSDMAMFEFIQTIDELLVPWKKWETSHKCLDSRDGPKVMEITLCMPEMLQLDEFRRHMSLWRFENKWNVEVVLQPNDIFRRYKRLAVFDMDSTLIQQEVIGEIARHGGIEAEVSKITERAMRGELDFTESLRERVHLLKGTPVTVLESIKSTITFTPGARELCKALKRLGYKMAVLSGGFIPLANYVKDELELDYAFANQLVVSEDGTKLTGELIGDIVHAERKALLLEQLARDNNIPLKQVIAIGDGANDLNMMHKAGMGIAFNAKPMVQLKAPCRLNSNTLLDVLYILGFTKEEQLQLLET